MVIELWCKDNKKTYSRPRYFAEGQFYQKYLFVFQGFERKNEKKSDFLLALMKKAVLLQCQNDWTSSSIG